MPLSSYYFSTPSLSLFLSLCVSYFTHTCSLLTFYARCRQDLLEGDLVQVATEWWGRSEGWGPHERLLAAGATVVWQLRKAVLDELGYTTSAGVSHYKLLAKLGSGAVPFCSKHQHKAAIQQCSCVCVCEPNPSFLYVPPQMRLPPLSLLLQASTSLHKRPSCLHQLCSLCCVTCPSADCEAVGDSLGRCVFLCCNATSSMHSTPVARL